MPQVNDIKTFVKGMNKDLDPRFLQPGEYLDAQNIMLSNYREGRAGGVTNFPGINQRVALSTTLGIFKDELNDQLYIFEYVSAGSMRIRTYNMITGSVTTLLDTSVLPWTSSTIIKSARVIEGILVWTDGDNEIGMFNTNFTYPTPYVAEMFTLAQVVPQNKPGVTTSHDSSYGYNNILGKFFQFKIRFIFETGHKSVFSPISEVAYSYDDYASPDIVAALTTQVNSIELTLDGTGASELVEKIEIAARSGNNGDFFSIATIDANATFQGGGTQSYTFYNESLYDPIALDESNQIYDDVPRTAQTLEIADNRVVVGDILTGYDKIDMDYSLAVSYGNLDDEGGLWNTNDSTYLALSGSYTPRTPLSSSSALTTFIQHFIPGYSPVAGDVITVAGVDIPSGTYDTYIHPFGSLSYTIASGDTWADVFGHITNSGAPYFAPTFYNWYASQGHSAIYLAIDDINTNNTGSPLYEGQPVGNDMYQISLTRGSHQKTFKSGAWYNVGFQYFDKYGRTNGTQIKDGARVYIPTLGERSLTPGSYTNAGAATIDVTIAHSPPSWAAYYKIVYSRANVNEFTLQTTVLGTTQDGSNTLLDISAIGSWNESKGGNLGYIWEKGDRVKILTYDQGGTIYTDWADNLIDAEIINDDSTGNYSILIPTPSGVSYSNLEGALIEIYRPSKELDATDSVFTEASPSYPITGGYHMGDTNQTAVVDAVVEITGDAYLKTREDYPYGSTPNYASITFEGYDISDFRESQHYDKGRPTAIINQEQSQKISTLMYSEFIIPNTDINNLNRFYPDVNYEEYERQFGKIKLIYGEADHLLMIQEDRVSKVYLNRQMMYDGRGSGTLVGTQQKVLSQSVPYSGTYGIHDWRTFQAKGNRRYWLDAARGVVVRLSNNGIEEISRYGMRGWFAEQCYDLVNSSNTVVRSVYDVQNDMYLLHLDGENTTVVFDEKTNAWVSFVDFITAEHSAYLNNKSFVVESGDLYEMNDYTNKNNGSQASYIKFACNAEPAELKNFLAIHLDSSHALDVTITTEAIDGGTDQSSTLDRTLDFTKREQEWHASFLRDANTPNVSNPLLEGDTLKGKHAEITLTLPAAVGDEDFTMKLAKIVVSKG
jgi:hypothetical protein